MPEDSVNFVLEVNHKFNSWQFFKEFKELQSEGHFSEVQHIKKLDARTGKEDELTEQDQFITKEDFIKYDIK